MGAGAEQCDSESEFQHQSRQKSENLTDPELTYEDLVALIKSDWTAS